MTSRARILVAVTTLAVAFASVGVPAGVASAQTAPTQSPDSRNPVSLKGTLAKTPGLSLTIAPLEPARVGGSGRITISLASTSRGHEPIKGLAVRVAAPSGASFRGLTGQGWACSQTSSQAALCRHLQPLGRSDDPAPITARVAIDTHVTRPAVSLKAWANWSGDHAPIGGWSVRSQAPLTVRPALSLKVESAQGPSVTMFRTGQPRDSQLLLGATLGNIDGGQVSATWFQVSGPKVQFLSARHLDQAPQRIEQVVQVPTRRDNQMYVFGVRIAGDGATLERRVRVHVSATDPLGTLTSPPVNVQRIADSTSLPDLDEAAVVRDGSPVVIDGPMRAVVNSSVTLTARSTGASIRTVVWTRANGSTAEGPSLRVTAAPVPGDSLLTRALVTLTDGHTYQVSAIVVAIPRQSAKRIAHPRTSDPRTTDPRTTSTFCAVAIKVRDSQADAGLGKAWLDLGATQKFSFSLADAQPTPEVFDAKGGCTGSGSLAISGGVLAHSSKVRLSEATATLTSDGLDISGARWTLSTGGTLTDQLGLKLTGLLSATSDGIGYTPIAGTMTFEPFGDEKASAKNGLNWIPLPTGWEFLPNASQVDFLTATDATPTHPAITDSTVRIRQIATSPPTSSGDRGELAMSIDVADDTVSLLRVAATNISLGETPNAGALLASGLAYMPLDDFSDLSDLRNGALHLDITCMAAGAPSSTCEVVKGFTLSNAKLNLNRTGLAISADAGIAYGSNQSYAFAVSGKYNGPLDWSVKARSTNIWDLGKGMSLSGLSGSISTRTASDGASGEFLVDLTGTFAGLTLSDGVTLTRLEPTLTNLCPQDDASCTTKDIRLTLAAQVTASIPGQAKPIEFDAQATVNLRTLTFTFKSGFSDAKFGPDALHLNAVQIVLTNDTLTGCVPLNADDTSMTNSDSKGFAVRISARATILEKQFDLSAQASNAGLCMWGNGPSMDLGEGFRAVTPRFTYTTYESGAAITFADGTVHRTVTPDQVSLTGGFEFSPSIKERFDIPGKGVLFTAIVSTDLTKAEFAVTYRANGEVNLYTGDGARLTMQDVGFRVSFNSATNSATSSAGTSQVSAGLFGTGDLIIAGANGGAESVTTLGVSGAFEFSATGIRIAIQAGVIADRPVRNAFGQPGLTVEELAVAASVDLMTGAPSISVNARATLPAGWSETIGVSPGTPLALAFSAGATAPCLEFALGRANSTTTAVDLAGLGLIKTNYFRLLLAPLGCTLPVGLGTKSVAPGWAFAFDGQLLGGPVAMAASISITNTGLILRTTAAFERWDLYGLTFRSLNGKGGPTFSLDIDTAARKYDVKFDAGLEIGNVSAGAGVLVAMKGGIDLSNDDSIGFDISGAGAVTLAGQRLDLRPVTVKANIPRSGKESATNRLLITAKIGIAVELLGQKISAAGDLDFRSGRLASLSVAADGEFDALVGQVKGTISFDMCLGTLVTTDDTAASPTGRACSLFPQDSWDRASYSLRIGLDGWSKWVLGDPKPYSWVIYEKNGKVAAA